MTAIPSPATSPLHLLKKHLSPARVRLIELMQDTNFGRIESLAIRDGQPLFSPSPRVVREVKFGGENGPRPEASIENFAIKTEVVELFRHMDELRDGVIDVLEIKHGLPFRMSFTEVPA